MSIFRKNDHIIIADITRLNQKTQNMISYSILTKTDLYEKSICFMPEHIFTSPSNDQKK